MRIAIFHDYFRVIGGAEKLVLILAKELGADIITAEADLDCISKTEIQGLNIITLGKLSKISDFLPMICRRRFSKCNFSKKYDFFIFSGSFSIYASKKHSPNMWYCHSPLRGLYDLRELKEKVEKTNDIH